MCINNMMRTYLIYGLIVLTFTALVKGQDRTGQHLDTSAWLADFAQLQDELAAHYSTLEWQHRARKMDLRQLADKTRADLRAAKDVPAARIAFRRFLAAFGDAHLGISWTAQPTVDASISSPDVDSRPLCTRLGYGEETAEPGINFATLASFRLMHTADDRYFPAGILVTANRRIGVLRIGMFAETPFKELCENAIREMGIAQTASCDSTCEDRIEAYTGDLLTAALVRQVQALKTKHIDLLAVDVTANPGGNDWGEPAARVLTARPIIGSRYGFIRHPHWVKNLRKDLAILEGDLPELSGNDRRRVEAAKPVLEKAIAAASTSCDLRLLWLNEPINCSLVVDTPLYVTGILPYAAPGTLPDRPSSHVLFSPSRYHYQEGAYRGPLVVLVDGHTASSAERFTAMLQDNRAATVVGLPTAGAGCGFTNGGIPVRLKMTGARVSVPDCMQLRRDLTNLVEGITPDVFVPWRSYDAPFQRAARAAMALGRVASRQSRR